MNKIVVAVGADNLAPGLLDLAMKAIIKDEGIEGTVTKEEYNGTEYYLIASGSLDPQQIEVAMSCLYDHISNTDMDEVIGNLWGGCVLADHVENDIECHGCKDECNYVNVGTFDYHGQDIIVDTYYITD